VPEKYKLTHAERAALLRSLLKLLRTRDEREFMSVLRKRGIKDEHPQFAEMVKLFRELSGKS
jgi:hypothetical protein